MKPIIKLEDIDVETGRWSCGVEVGSAVVGHDRRDKLSRAVALKAAKQIARAEQAYGPLKRACEDALRNLPEDGDCAKVIQTALKTAAKKVRVFEIRSGSL